MKPQKAIDFLSGGGEMGELTRTKDWGQTPLGDPAQWPQSLRTTVSILLHSDFPMFLWWGNDLIQFYNDAYRPSLGIEGKHPSALGQKGIDCWPEIWDIIKPLIDKVMNEGVSTWSEDQLIPIFRNGKLEDVYWTFSYSPVYDETGAVNAVLVVCSETTEKVLALKKIGLSETKLKFTIDAAELGTWDLDPATNEFIGNDRLKNWFGLLPTEKINLKNAIDAIVEKDKEKVTDAILNALKPASGGAYEIEYDILNASNNIQRTVLAKGKAAFNDENTAERFSGILQDITRRKQTETALRESEERFRNTVAQAPVGILILRGKNFIVETANDTYLRLVDRKKENFINKSLFISLPEVTDTVKPILENVIETGEPYYGMEFEVPLTRFGKKETAFFNFVYQALKDSNQHIGGVIVIATEVTTQVRAKHELQESEKRFRNLITRSPVPMAVFRGRDHVIELANNSMLDTIWRRKPEEVQDKKLLDVFPELAGQKFPELLKLVFETGRRYSEKETVAYIHAGSEKRKFYLDFDYSPLFAADNTVSGIIATVNDVTEKVEARQQIKDSADRLLLATEGTELATWDLNLQTLEIVHSPRLALIFGHNESRKIEHPVLRSQILEADRMTIVEKAFEDALINGDYFYEARIIHPDNSVHWIRTRGKVVFDENKIPVRMLGTLAEITSQKMAEEQVSMLAAIVHSSDDAIMSKTLEGIITSWNEAAERLFGYTAAEMIGQSIRKLIPPDKLHEEDLIIAQLRKGNRIEHFQTMRLTKENKLIEISLTVSPIKGRDGKVIGASKIARDISRQKQNERLIAESKEQLEIVITASELGTWELILHSGDISYSPRYLEILGFHATGSLNYQDFIRHLHPDDAANREQAFVTAYKTGNLHHVSRFIWDDKSIHWIEIKGKVFYDVEKEPFKIIGTIRDLTDEKLFQQRIEESEQRFRSVADTAPALIWMANAEKLFTFFNKPWLAFRGKTTEQERGVGWMEGIHPEDLEQYLEAYNVHFGERTEFYLEYRLKRHDGDYRWVSDNAVPRFTQDGIFEGFIGACMDIHDRIIFEEKLKESESRLRIAALSGELGTWDYSPEKEVMIWDNASRDLFGVSGNEMITVPFFLSKIHPDDLEQTMRKMQDAMNPEIAEHYDAEYRVIGLPGNELRWIHARGKALFSEDGTAYRFSGTVLDITEKKLALEELQENVQRYRFLADAMPQFVWTGGADGILNYFNKSVYDYSGLSVENVAKEGWMQIVHPEDRDENIEKWIHSVNTGEPFLFEHRFKRHDGIYRWQLSRAIPQKDEEGNIQMWVGTSTDIDELKKHELQKNDFIKMANHELKTPVTTIKGYVQLLLKTYAGRGDAILTSSLSTMDKQVTKLTNLVSDLLDITKIERGSLPLNKEIFPIGDLVKDVIKDMAAASQTHTILFNENTNPDVLADKDRISQVLLNLFTNAYKYSPRAENVVVEINTAGKNVVVSVQDFGIGINTDDQQKIFERFYRVSGKDEKTFPGFGIGLYIVNEIVQLHDGKIWVESEKDNGATFYFSLPVQNK